MYLYDSRPGLIGFVVKNVVLRQVFLPNISVFLPSISGFPLSIQPVLQDHAVLTFWRRNYFFLILAQPVYKMWIIQEPNTIELWNKLHFEEEKTEFIPCLKYSVPIFVE